MQIQTTRTHTINRMGSAQIALLLVLGSETIFFGTLLSSYLFMRSNAAPRPPVAGTGLLMPILNTLVLLGSTLIANRAQRAILQDRRQGLRLGIQITLALGLVFVTGQVAEFLRSGCIPATRAWPACTLP